MNNVVLTIKETKQPEGGYLLFSNSIVITFEYAVENSTVKWKIVSVENGNDKSWGAPPSESAQYIDYRMDDDRFRLGITENVLTGIPGLENKFIISVINDKIPTINLQLAKIDNVGNNVSGAKFKVIASQDGKPLTLNPQMPSDGYSINKPTSITILPENMSNVTVTITESKPPENHLGLSHSIEITYKYTEIKNEFGNVEKVEWQIISITDGKQPWEGNQNPSSVRNEYTLGIDKFYLMVLGNSFGISIQNYKIPDLELQLFKLNTALQPLAGAKFSVNAVQGRKTLVNGTYPNDTNSNYNPITIAIQNLKSTEDIIVTIKEVFPPRGHIGISREIRIIYKYEGVKWKVSSVQYKDTDGIYKDWDVNTLKEKGHTEYYVNKGLTNNGNTDYDRILLTTNTEDPLISKYKIELLNRPKVSFQFKKTDKLTNRGIPGIKFNIKIEDCAGGPTNITNVSDRTNLDIVTDITGLIRLEDLEFTQDGTGYKDIIITLTEKEVPVDGNGYPIYSFLEGPIIIRLKYVMRRDTPTIELTYEYAGNIEDVQEIDNEETNGNILLGIIAKDQPVIHLGGKVWLDIEQNAGKTTEAPNGKIDTKVDTYIAEEGIGEIPLYLFKTEDGGKTYTRVTKSSYGENLMTQTSTGESILQNGSPASDAVSYVNANNTTSRKTLMKGDYFFPNLPKLANGWYVIFYSYDGVNYIATIEDGLDQYASESAVPFIGDIRTIFNERLETINASTKLKDAITLSDNGQVSKLSFVPYASLDFDTQSIGEYEYYAGKTGNNTSILKTTYDYDIKNRKNGVNVKNEFKIYSRTIAEYNRTALSINFGLQERKLDLALENQLTKAEVSINGKSTVYEYANEYVDPTIKIEDYGEKMSYTTKNQHHLKLYKSDYDYDNRGQDELEVYATYAIHLDNKGITNLHQKGVIANINEIVDYYDTNYEFVSAWVEYENMYKQLQPSVGGSISIGGKSYNQVKLTFANGAIATLGNSETGAKYNTRETMYITFKVKNVGSDIDLGEYNNVAEITEYSTYASDGKTPLGLVDNDSKPNSSVLNSQLQYEDDTDMARGLIIEVPGEDPKTKIRERTITGNVWEDMKNKTGRDGEYQYGNGEIDATERGLEGIQVQLIEMDGTNEIVIDTKTTDNRGNYTFTGIVPGDYIVRFTYNGQTYNGQNYKSTTVNTTHYNNEVNHEYNWFYNTLYINSSRRELYTSKAIDKATRRIELMSRFAEITKDNYPDKQNRDGSLGMTANTPIIRVAVDTDDPSDIGTTQVVADGNNPIDLRFQGVNFGIEKRPATKITLEKHIRRVSFKANDIRDFLQAAVKNDYIDTVLFNEEKTVLSDNPNILEGLKEGLIATKTTRNNGEGTWAIHTDIAELTQGGILETEIIYRVKNEGEVDYISKSLNNKYMRLPLDRYINSLNGLATDNSQALSAIGGTYFTGDTSLSSVSKVGVKVESIRDYLDGLKYEKSDSFTVKEENKEKTVLDTNGSPTKQNIEQVIESRATNILLPENKEEFTVTLKIDGLTPTGKLAFENYISQIMSYTIPTGRQDENATPGNLEERNVYSYDTDVKLNAYEHDEYGAERISIEPPTGENRETPVIMIVSITAGIAILGVGIIIIKKFVIK